MYAVTGATGNTGSVIVKQLLARGQRVRAIGRNPKTLQSLAAVGAEPHRCDTLDAGALTAAFQGARGVFVMVPPNMAVLDYRAFQRQVADASAAALRGAGVKYAVSLSSLGAELAEGTGPIAGLHYLEQALNQIDNLNALHLRPAYFMENTLAQSGIIQAMGMTAGPLQPGLRLPMIATEDIGTAASQELIELNFRGKATRELLGQRDLSMTEVAQIIGRAIGKPDLSYRRLPDEQVRGALMQLGMSPDSAGLILEMSAALNSGRVKALEARSKRNTTATSYEVFVEKYFLPRYKAAATAA